MKIDGGLRKLFRLHVPQAMWVTIESASTEQGIPDSFYCFERGIAGWVEMKWTDANAVVFQPGQTAWHERYARMGGRSFIAVRFRRGRTARLDSADKLMLYPGAKARSLQLGGREATAPIGYWSDGPARWDWKKVAAILQDKWRRP